MNNEEMEITVYTQAQYQRLMDRVNMLEAAIKERDSTIIELSKDIGNTSASVMILKAEISELNKLAESNDEAIDKQAKRIAYMQDEYIKLSGEKMTILEDSEAAQESFILINKKLESDINEYRMAAKRRDEIMVIQRREIETLKHTIESTGKGVYIETDENLFVDGFGAVDGEAVMDNEELIVLRQECERYESEKLSLIRVVNLLADEICRKLWDTNP